MKLTLENTDQIVTIDPQMQLVKGRVWDGVTENGVRVQCIIIRVAVHKDDDSSQFERELEENPPKPAEGVRAFDARFIL